MSAASNLRTLLQQPTPVIAPGIYDALTALLVEQAGFSCAYVSGASVSFTRLGRPDLGLTTLTEVADTVARMRERVELPLIVDADTGFGNALNVQRSVALLERMGATAIQLEDQTAPKRCGHLAGKSLIATSEMAGKIKAACDARADDATLVVARTDAIAVENIDAAIERGFNYVEAGADVLFVEAMRDVAQLQRVGEELGAKVPLLANMVEGGKTPLKPAQELGELGFSLIIYPGAMVRVVAKAATEYLQVLQSDGSTLNHLDRMFNFDQVMNLVGLNEMVEAAQQYSDEINRASD
ncbi:MAG: isocitrate lyase/PEP mutase family protein [Gammaproteobacteria bacterium]